MRPLIYGNGTLLVCVDERGVVRDFYYPYAGMENHGGYVRLGLFDLEDGRFGWLEGWDVRQGYQDASLIGETVYESREFEARVTVKEMVHQEQNFFLRSIEVADTSKRPRRLRLFSSQNYHILENNYANTAVRDGPMMSHYKRDRFILQSSQPAFDQFTTGISQWRGMEGTWKDAEDGVLEGNVVSHGTADSTLGWTLALEPGKSSTVHFWACIGRNFPEAKRIDSWIMEKGVEAIYRSSRRFWGSFCMKARSPLLELPASIREAFNRSLLTVACHLDRGGSVIASCDSEIKQQGADYYTYCWPRDAAWVAIALDRAGYGQLSFQILQFFKRIIDKRGYFRHKYTPAGDLGSTWHPLPMVQIDETATPIYAAYVHWLESEDVRELSSLYEPLVKPAADSLVRFLSDGLPGPSYDLWEERKGVYTYSCATVFAGLRGASAMAFALGDDVSAERWGEAARILRENAVSRLYDPSLGRFKRGIGDDTVDASLFAAWYLGLVKDDDPMAEGTMNSIEKELCRPSGGVARYTGDGYQGYMNSWPLCTLWLAQWHIRRGRLDKALGLMEWCVRSSAPTGLMPEQVGDKGEPLSVLPLAWSHSTFILAVVEYLDALKKWLRAKV
ncbi:glycoside hydrolase family 15 protein [Methanocella conradii]|uniref:glycoside hydrolase family 15 protein n=1 Tax=Methanocella conradii TaxID=1175444 RepID=UPI0024B3A868|nr:glycoside hydrolase family 15 protein [Methanocella conradii]MDI6897781.1 glycoside hydrolase family 15 protein [Methanocella conradii]